MSDWLSIIIIILIVGIVLDGIRRARNSRKNELRLSKNARKVDRLFEKEAEASGSSELPFGGARTRVASDSRDENANPVQESLELDEPVPMLMETIAQEEDVEQDDSEVEDVFSPESQNEPKLGELENLDLPSELDEGLPKDVPEVTPSEVHQSNSYSDQVVEEPSTQNEPESSNEDAVPEEILIVNIMAKSGLMIDGGALLDAFSAEKLKYGQRGIFHRHLDNDGDAPVLYSVANILEPGSFNFAEMKNSETPGVCVFLSLPSAGNAISAYDDMIDTARTISAKLACELSDENRSILTKQTIEHGRQRVIEFERKNKLRKNSST